MHILVVLALGLRLGLAHLLALLLRLALHAVGLHLQLRLLRVDVHRAALHAEVEHHVVGRARRQLLVLARLEVEHHDVGGDVGVVRREHARDIVVQLLLRQLQLVLRHHCGARGHVEHVVHRPGVRRASAAARSPAAPFGTLLAGLPLGRHGAARSVPPAPRLQRLTATGPGHALNRRAGALRAADARLEPARALGSLARLSVSSLY
mmetsp:Transcript_84867/g.205780  ORF Transcript_84867/g.205780 Transcript_84867/m.205780 type:complete len:207 (-) Transcript_84867:155-775(-)